MARLSFKDIVSVLVVVGTAAVNAAVLRQRDCSFTWPATVGDTCQTMADSWAITVSQFISYNPGVNCASLFADRWYCVEWTGEPPAPPPVTTTVPTTTRTTTTAATTTTSTGNGVQTPQPTQPNMVTNCNKFYFVSPGEECTAVLTANGITLAQLFAWNPSVRDNCSGLWASVNVCVGIIGGAPNPTTTTTSSRPPVTTTTTSPGNGIQTPSPAMPGMVSNCDRFYKVKAGDTCASIGGAHNVRADRIQQWQPTVGTTCGGLWLDTYVCVRTVGFQPQTQTRCGVGNGKTWGGNKPAALSSVVLWCNGDSATDGSGPFDIAQTKTGCYNAPMGTNKFNFSARNGYGAPTSLSVAKCNELVNLAVNGCDNGGALTQEGWSISAVVVAGRC